MADTRGVDRRSGHGDDALDDPDGRAPGDLLLDEAGRYGEVLRPDWASVISRVPHPLDGTRCYVAPTPASAAGEPTLILLHGIGNDGGTFGPILPVLAERRPVVAPTLRPKLLVPGDDPADNVAPLVGFLTALAPPPWHIVGHSMGGVIAGLLMRARPDLVAGAVLVNSPLPGVTRRIRDGDTFDRAGRALIMLKALAQISAFGRPRLPRLARPAETLVVRNALRGFIRHPGALDGGVVEGAVTSTRTRDGDRFLRLARQLPEWESDPFVASPVHIVLGAEDPLVPADDVELVAAAYPEATIEVLGGGAHIAHHEWPQAIVDPIDDPGPTW